MAKRVGIPPEAARDAVAVLHDRNLNLAEIARALGITRQAITGWRAVPAEWVRQLSDVTGIPPWKLRPDLYDAPPPETADAG
jgi:transposase-like protein